MIQILLSIIGTRIDFAILVLPADVMKEVESVIVARVACWAVEVKYIPP